MFLVVSFRDSAIARFAHADILFCHALKINSDRENLPYGSVPKFGRLVSDRNRIRNSIFRSVV